MEVSQIKELDTHAVIGGGEAEAFGISEDAEFFTVLSDTLYRDKMRAVVRETICNGWDAHIMVRKTDVPLEITLTDDELIIKDFGPGIEHSRIRPIYCIYGKSTKVSDGRQTGGFGLGSKAPFAYADHFSVTSCFEGTRTVYAASRGGQETKGKPDMRAMVQVPTTESGITVTIPVASHSDRLDFANHIKSVVMQGGMKANLNGEPLVSFDYGQARKSGFAVMPHGVYELGEAKVYCLYGTVLYPVTTTDKTITAATDRLAKLLGDEDKARFVVVAPPHSIGVTPSRESLSYSDRTTSTILGLLTKAEKFIRANGPAAAARVAQERIERFGSLLSYGEHTYLNGNDYAVPGKALITDPVEITRYALNVRFYDVLGSIKAKSLEVKAFAKKFPDHRRHYRRLGAELGSTSRCNPYRSEWLHQIRLHLRAAADLGVLDSLLVTGDRWLEPINKLYIHGPHALRIDRTVIIARTRKDAAAEAKNMGGGRRICLVLPKADDAFVETVEARLEHYKIPFETLDFSRPEKKKPVKRPKTVFRFSEIAFDKQKRTYSLKGEPTLEKAPYYVRLGGTLDDIRMPNTWHQVFDKINEVFPDCAVAFDKVQEERLQKAGAKPLVAHVIAELEKLGESKEVQYAFMAAAKEFVIDSFSHKSAGDLVSALCASNLRFAKYFFPVKGVRIGPKTDRAMELVKFVNRAIYGVEYYEKSDLRDMFRAAKEKIERKALKTFDYLRKRETHPHFEFLKPVRECSVGDFSVDHWFDLFAALKRPYERQMARRKTEQEAAEMKEAA